MIKSTSFIRQFIKNKKTIGAVLPSSFFLRRKILKKVYKKGSVFVEFGPGTGAFTFDIIKSLPTDSHFLIFEVNNSFHEKLKQKINDPRVILINDGAENLDKHLSLNNLKKADVIISSLPLTNFNEKLRSQILKKSFENLNNNGRYIQYQYTKNAKEEIESIFKAKNVRTEFVFINIPPAFVYTCKKSV